MCFLNWVDFFVYFFGCEIWVVFIYVEMFVVYCLVDVFLCIILGMLMDDLGNVWVVSIIMIFG